MPDLQVFADETGRAGRFYRAYAPRPEGLVQDPVTGVFRHPMTGRIQCEDCWIDIPPYEDFPTGLVSPEASGDRGGNFIKAQPQAIEGLMGIWHMQKAVCLPCYLAAFRRVYPDAPCPELRSAVRGQPVSPEPVINGGFVPEPKST